MMKIITAWLSILLTSPLLTLYVLGAYALYHFMRRIPLVDAGDLDFEFTMTWKGLILVDMAGIFANLFFLAIVFAGLILMKPYFEKPITEIAVGGAVTFVSCGVIYAGIFPAGIWVTIILAIAQSLLVSVLIWQERIYQKRIPVS